MITDEEKKDYQTTCQVCRKLRIDCECPNDDIYMEQVWKEIYEEENKRLKEMKRFIDNELKPIVSKEYFKFIMEIMEDSDQTYNCRFEEKPTGHKQNDNGFDYYVDQMSVGMSGDSFEGDIYLPLKNKKYFAFSYSC